MDVGKEVPNHYKPEFEFSKLYLFTFTYIVFEFVVIEKIFKNPIQPPPLLSVFLN